MAKKFNTSVTCDPEKHYMVDTTAKMKVFESMINDKCYFTINRARQFGKSTSLKDLTTISKGVLQTNDSEYVRLVSLISEVWDEAKEKAACRKHRIA